MSTSNEVPSSSKIEFISTKRGSVSILHDGRRYHLKKIYVNGNSFWKCIHRGACRGNLTLNKSNELLKLKEHNDDCEAKHGNNIILKEIDNLKMRTSRNFDSIQKQYNNVIRKLKDDGIEFLIEIPKFSSVKTGLYNERNNSLSRLEQCRDIMIPIPEQFESFLLSEYSDEEKRIMVFCSNESRQQIGNYKHFFADGTYKCCPLTFKQLYTIHAYDEEQQCITPLIFALLPDKTMKTYGILFRIIKSQLPTWIPNKITLDFEVAAISAFKKVFPDIIFKGCYYHFNRSLWRKAKSLKITSQVKKRHVTRCVGIAHLPKEFRKKGLDYVMSRSPKGDEINKFDRYYHEQWYKKKQFQTSCCCDKNKIRSNNNIDGWHAKIKNRIGRKYPTLGQLLDILATESTSYDFKKVSNKKQIEFDEIDSEIDLALTDLKENKITVGHCLEIISSF